MKFILDSAEIEAMKESGIKFKEYTAEWEKGYCVNVGNGTSSDTKVKFFQQDDNPVVEIPDAVVDDIKMNDDVVGFVEFIPYGGNKIEIKVF